MQPSDWQPSVELSVQEEQMVKRIRKATLFVFFRRHRQERFDEAFQREWVCLSQEAERGQPPGPPAVLALALLLEASPGVSDDEVIEATVMDRRWQLVLDCVETEEAPFRKGTRVAFRRRLMEGQRDRRLIERTIEMASQRQACGPRAFRAALERRPLWGAGRVEDPSHPVGHARKKVRRVVADRASEGAGRDRHRGGSSARVWEQSESNVSSRLGPTRRERGGVAPRLERPTSRRNRGADPPTGRSAPGSGPSLDGTAGERTRCAWG